MSEQTPSLAELVATTIMGWEALHVDYFGTAEVTLRQRELEAWFADIGISLVGNYYINPSINFWINATDWRPDERWADTMQLVEQAMAQGHVIITMADGQRRTNADPRYVVLVDERDRMSGNNGPETVCRALLAAYGVAYDYP